MGGKIGGDPATGLERSGGKAGSSDWLRFARPAPGLDRLDAFFSGHAYDDHRHDTYAIGLTLSGVQCFDCRGARRDSVAGQVIVVYPDEAHNGRAGVAEFGAGSRAGQRRCGFRQLRLRRRSRLGPARLRRVGSVEPA